MNGKILEAVVCTCSGKKMFLKISKNLQENTFAKVSLLTKLPKGTLFYRTPLVASKKSELIVNVIFTHGYNYFTFSLVKKRLNERIIYPQFFISYWGNFLKLIKFITQCYLFIASEILVTLSKKASVTIFSDSLLTSFFLADFQC